jgi:hypothetical protein
MHLRSAIRGPAMRSRPPPRGSAPTAGEGVAPGAREDSPYGVGLGTPEHARPQPNHVDPERSAYFRELSQKGVAARRAKKARAPREAVQEAVERLIVEDADSVARALLKSPAGVDRLLQLGAGIFAERKPEPTVIVMRSAFADVNWRAKPAQWLRLLEAGDIRQLRAELVAHTEEPA